MPFGPAGQSQPADGFIPGPYAPGAFASAYAVAAAPPASLVIAPKGVGNKLVFCIITQSSSVTGISGITDTAGNTWVQDFAVAAVNGTNGGMQFWSTTVGNNSQPITVTPTYTGGDNTHNTAIAILEITSPFGSEAVWVGGPTGSSIPGTAGNLTLASLTTANQIFGSAYIGVAASFGSIVRGSVTPATPTWEQLEPGGGGVSGRFIVFGWALPQNTAEAPGLGNAGGNPYSASILYSAT